MHVSVCIYGICRNMCGCEYIYSYNQQIEETHYVQVLVKHFQKLTPYQVILYYCRELI